MTSRRIIWGFHFVCASRIFALLFILPLALDISQAASLENLPLDHWAYELVRTPWVAASFSHLHPNSHPLRRGELAQALLGMNHLSEPDRWFVEKLRQELALELADSSTRDLRADIVLSYVGRGSDGALTLLGEGSLRLGPCVGVVHRLRLDSGDYRPSHLLVEPWRGDLSGVVEHAYLWADFGRLDLFVGRDRLQWGPGRRGETLLLSSHAPAFDMIKVEGNVGPVRFIAFSSVLDDLQVAPDSVAHRYLSGHRVSLVVGRVLEVGLSETVLYGGPGRNIEPCYLNPLTLYYGEQHNRRKNDNVFWGGDISIRPRSSLEIFVEFLADDFQYDFETEPHEIAVQVGFRCGGPMRSSLHAEYTRINNWVYGHSQPWNVYTFHGELIGHPLGPDADGLYLLVSQELSKAVHWEVSFEHRRKGQGREDIPRSSVVPGGADFPSGVVEKEDIVGLTWEYFPKADLRLRVGFEHRRVVNQMNFSGRDDEDVELHLDLVYRIRLFD